MIFWVFSTAPVQDWTYSNNETAQERFRAINEGGRDQQKFMWLKGEKRRRFEGATLFQTQKCESVYPVKIEDKTRKPIPSRA